MILHSLGRLSVPQSLLRLGRRSTRFLQLPLPPIPSFEVLAGVDLLRINP